MLSVIGILSVVFTSFTLQPLMFNFLVKQQGKKRSVPVTAKDLFFSIATIINLIIGAVLSFILELLLKIIPGKENKKQLFFHRWISLLLKFIHKTPLNIKSYVNNPFGEKFEKPAVIIANHQAHIDIALIMMLNPKILILTNNWVQRNIFYGRIVKFANYYPVSNGVEKNSRLLKNKIKEGYSVLIFPEGTRSKNHSIGRFHNGAFYYAEHFGLDILPIILQGTGDCIPKGEPFLKTGRISININKRIAPKKYGNKLRDQAKAFRKLMQNRYDEISNINQTVDYYKNKVIANYIYKGPILENYLRIKIAAEDNYSLFDELCPKIGTITDIGCGYGFLDYMLSFVSPGRKITGIDYDCDKIETAKHNISHSKNLKFICSDVSESNIPKSDIFILADILHYMPKPKQTELIENCIKKLNPNGKIIIRDGNTEMQKKHKGTKLSEFLSTRVVKFNKAKYNQLYFTSKTEIRKIADNNNLKVDIVDKTKHTSNLIYVLSNKFINI